MNEAIISIKPEFVDKICSGEKSIELRNRKINLTPGTRLWIYSTLPSGTLEAYAIIKKVAFASPQIIWDYFSDKIQLNKEDFDAYTEGYENVSAIIFNHVVKINPALSLNSMRDHHQNFHPPQFYKWIKSENPLFSLFSLIVKNELKEYDLCYVNSL